MSSQVSALPVQMRNKAQPLMMMKMIAGAKARYASYDNQKLNQMIQIQTGTLNNSTVFSANSDSKSRKFKQQPSGTDEMKTLAAATSQRVISPENPSTVTFRVASNKHTTSHKHTGTFENVNEDNSNHNASPHKGMSLQLTLEEMPLSKHADDEEIQLFTDGDAGEVVVNNNSKSEDSDKEVMVSAGASSTISP